MGSPVASAVSGPGTAWTKARRLESGDQAKRFPMVGSGLLVPSSADKNFAAEPSGWDTIRPDLSPSLPLWAIHCPSGDHSGLPDDSFSFEKRTERPSARVITHSCEYGRPGPSLWLTVYARRAPSGESVTPPA